MGPDGVVLRQPPCRFLADLIQGHKAPGIENSIAVDTVESFDKRILRRFSRLNIHQRYTLDIRPVNQRLRNVLRAVVQTEA